ncbi:MAG: heme exporter protein CcmB [Thermoleophilia bacterium]|nr:heme exporter protein CcmB [Thermoleophilia bacterium]
MSASRGRQLRALVRKDLQLEARTRETVTAMALFALVAMVVFQFAVGQRSDDATGVAGGIIWATIALAAVLGVGRTWVPEREQRVLHGVLVAPVPRLVMLIARVIVLWLFLLAIEVLIVPLGVVFFVHDASPEGLALVAGLCAVANLAIAVPGALLASMSVFSRARELVIPVLLLPALVPVVIAAAGGTHAVLGPEVQMAEFLGYCRFLAVCAAVFCLVAYATFDHVLDD